MGTKEVVNSYFSSLQNRSDWQSFLADDMTFTSFTSPIKQTSGRVAYLAATKRFYSMITAVELRRLMVDGEQACALTRYTLQPPGRPSFSCDVAEVFSVRAGKVASFDIYFDTAPFPK